MRGRSGPAGRRFAADIGGSLVRPLQESRRTRRIDTGIDCQTPTHEKLATAPQNPTRNTIFAPSAPAAFPPASPAMLKRGVLSFDDRDAGRDGGRSTESEPDRRDAEDSGQRVRRDPRSVRDEALAQMLFSRPALRAEPVAVREQRDACPPPRRSRRAGSRSFPRRESVGMTDPAASAAGSISAVAWRNGENRTMNMNITHDRDLHRPFSNDSVLPRIQTNDERRRESGSSPRRSPTVRERARGRPARRRP